MPRPKYLLPPPPPHKDLDVEAMVRDMNKRETGHLPQGISLRVGETVQVYIRHRSGFILGSTSVTVLEVVEGSDQLFIGTDFRTYHYRQIQRVISRVTPEEMKFHYANPYNTSEQKRQAIFALREVTAQKKTKAAAAGTGYRRN